MAAPFADVSSRRGCALFLVQRVLPVQELRQMKAHVAELERKASEKKKA